MSKFKVGDIVKHKASYLKSIGMYTNVPVDGKVLLGSQDGDCFRHNWIKVQWCDREDAVSILDCNVMLASEPDYSGM